MKRTRIFAGAVACCALMAFGAGCVAYVGTGNVAYAQESGKENITFNDALAAFNYGDNELAAKQFKKLADEDDSRAQYYYAYLLDMGLGVGKDITAAAKWYHKAALQDFLPAVVYMGYLTSTGHGVKRNDKEAFRWYGRGAQMGDSIAQNNVATMLLVGRPYRQDLLLAAQWFLQSAMQGNARAQYNLATMYRLGKGIKRNYAEAFRWYTYASNQGDMYAQNALGYMYRKGIGTEKNPDTAVEWYRRAAEQGHMASQYSIALMYETGEAGPEKGLTDAAIWYFHAAQQGHEKARLRLAAMYEKGAGVPQDSKEAFNWYNKAVRENISYPAMIALGQYYESGKNSGKKDLSKAAELYKRGAQYGDIACMLELGRVYAEGIGVGKSARESYKWFFIAAQLAADEDLKGAAIIARTKMATLLKPEELANGKKEALLWKPVPAPEPQIVLPVDDSILRDDSLQDNKKPAFVYE